MKAFNLEKLLPADLPPGERVLWFGRPEPVSLWRRAYRADWISVWFVGIAAWNFASLAQSYGALAGFVSALRTLGFGAAALAIIAALAWASARTTLYVVTERRIIVKSGLALPMFINVPFKQIVAASVRSYADGTGEVTVGVVEGERIPYLALWPSARPLRFARPEPALRCIADPRRVAETIARALAEASGQSLPTRAPAKAVEPGRIATAAA